MSLSQFHITKMSVFQRLLIILMIGVLWLFAASHAGGQAEPPGVAGDAPLTAIPTAVPRETPQPYVAFQLALAPNLAPADREHLLTQLRARYRGDVAPVGNLSVRVVAPANALADLRSLPGVTFADKVSAAVMAPARILANGAITGVITEDGSGVPLENVGVCAYQESPHVYVCEASGAAGVYSISLPAGVYQLIFYPGGLHISEYYDNVAADQGQNYTPVTVHDDTVTPNINAGLAVGAYVNGRITADADGAPIQGVQVTVSTNSRNANGLSDANGVYTTTPGLPPGEYQVSIYHIQYAREYYDNTYIAPQATPLIVTTTHRLGVNAALTTAASISGTVTGSGPLQNVTVSARYGDYDQHVAGETTDSQGHYQLYALGPIAYKLQFSDNNGQYLTEWHEDQSSWATADLITLTAGVTTTLNTQLSQGSAITGVVTADDSGAPLDNIGVSVYEAASGDYVGYDTTDATGAYRIGGLTAGDYRMLFQDNLGRYLSEYYDNEINFYEADAVALGAEMTQTVNIALAKGGSISGRVVDAVSGAGIVNVGISSERKDGASFGGYTATDAQGYYTATNMYPGVYQVRFQPPQPYYATYYDNARRQNAFTPIVVTAGITAAGIDARLRQGYLITGVVSGPPSLSGIPVNAYYAADGSSSAQSSTRSDGVYQLGPLPPGPYRVYFMPNNLYAGEWYSDAYRYRDARLVNITDHTVPNINAHLETGGRITGTVAGAGGVPLAYANIRIYQVENPKMFISTGADDQGRYATGMGLPPGQYQVEFVAPPGYVTQWYANAPARDSATPITITASSVVANVNAVLARRECGAITGTVTAADTGLPIYAWVNAYDEQGYHVRGVDANDGHYVMDNLPAGAYRLQFSNATIPYVWTYYHDKESFSEADRITVTAGMTVTHINQALQRGGAITGVVSGPGGIPGMVVNAYRVSSGGYSSESTYTGPDGSYKIQGLIPGDYKVKFSPTVTFIEQWYAGAGDEDSAQTISVTSGAILPNINATLSQGGVITGVITAQDSGAAMPNTSVRVHDETGNSVGEQVYADADGHYQTPGLPAGSYKLFFDRQDWQFHRSEWYNQKDDWNAAISVTVSAPGVIPNINAALKRGGSISGWVDDAATGYALADGYAYIYDAQTQSSKGYCYVNQWGHYQVGGLENGSYKAGFFTDDYPTQWYSQTLNFESALTITVAAPNDTPDINFHLKPFKKVYLPLVLRSGS